MLIATLLAGVLLAEGQALESASSERPAVCLSAKDSDSGLIAAESRELGDSVNDLRRALGMLDKRHKFSIAPGTGACSIRLVVMQRLEDEDEETHTVVTRLTATAHAGGLHDEELRATAGTWRGAASEIARSVAYFVDRNRASLGGPLPARGDSKLPEPEAVTTTSAPRATPSPAPASPSAPRTPSGGRTIEDGILDWVRLHGDGGQTMLTPIYMRLFSTDTARLGTGGDGGKETRASEAKTLQGQGPALLREAFLASASTAGLSAHVVDESTAATLPPAAVVIEGAFVTIDPGSRTKRYFVGFGAGKSAIEIAGRFLTPTGETLGEFRHRRIGVMGMGGGDSLGKLLSDTRSCGEDIAKFVAAWLANKPLK